MDLQRRATAVRREDAYWKLVPREATFALSSSGSWVTRGLVVGVGVMGWSSSSDAAGGLVDRQVLTCL